MKINGPTRTGPASGPSPSRGVASGGQGFSLPSVEPALAPLLAARAGALNGVMNLDALLALQDVGGPLERKRRAVRRAGRILDILDAVKLGVLSGEIAPTDLANLQTAVRDQREDLDDPGLTAVLNEIETRAAVEIAKLERSGRFSGVRA